MYNMPDKKGHFGPYGGVFASETLIYALTELKNAYEHYRNDPEFDKEWRDELKHYVGRPSPIYWCRRLSEVTGGAQIYLKREDLNHTGAHKINNTMGQALLARRMGKKRVIAETGAGQHGVATATVADLHDLERKVRKAMSMHGARYIQILVPCPLGWGFASDKTVEVARLAAETGIFPVFEAENGEITGSYKIRRPTPVEAYLKLQKRFAHLLGKKGDPETVARLQRMANRNIEKFGLTEEAEEHPEGLFRSLVSPKGDAESV